jgi:hypothetical protein
MLFFTGFRPPRKAYLLTGQPGHFVQMAQDDGVALDAAEQAIAYAVAYLETTRSMSDLVYLVRSVDDVQVRPNLEDEEMTAAVGFTEQYRTIIVPPAAEATSGGFVVTAYAIREQALERHRLSVHRDGGIQPTVETLETDLPLVYGL